MFLIPKECGWILTMKMKATKERTTTGLTCLLSFVLTLVPVQVEFVAVMDKTGMYSVYRRSIYCIMFLLGAIGHSHSMGHPNHSLSGTGTRWKGMPICAMNLFRLFSRKECSTKSYSRRRRDNISGLYANSEFKFAG